MKIALIGPGIMPIPPQGWGSVEKIIWIHHNELIARGHVVDIYNSQNLDEVANNINNKDYDFVHCHYDVFAEELCRKIHKPFCLTSHWGEIKEQAAWDVHGGWWNPIFQGMLKCRGMIGLTPEINEVYRRRGYRGFLDVLPVGTDVADFAISQNPTFSAICLGKIEPRKMQAELANAVRNKCCVDFVGPNVDPRFVANETAFYRDAWNREEVTQNLTKYKCLILLSTGEGAPQVVPEAMSAGLSILVTETAAGNLDRSLPFIKVIPNNWYQLNVNISEIINQLCAENHQYRIDIRNYAENQFDISKIVTNYEQIMIKFMEYCR